jgi:hypothetical protein
MISRTTLWLLLAAPGPVIHTSLYLLLSRRLVHDVDGLSDGVAVAVSCLAGVLGVAKSSPPGWPKPLVILIYVPLMAAFLLFYDFLFLCAGFQACLWHGVGARLGRAGHGGAAGVGESAQPASVAELRSA